MKGFLVFVILLASSFAGSAIASEVQVIHRNDQPRSCSMSKGKEAIRCNLFMLVKDGEVHTFGFFFEGNVFAFVGLLVGDSTYAVGQLYYGGETHDLETLGSCVTSGQYEYILCSAGGVRAEYSR
jgi:hypothetical protein